MNNPSPNALPLAVKPELLAPAGGRPQLEAAVAAGADAVYFGLDSGLNARVRATSFGATQLPATMDWLHERGVRGYLTLNTLVFDEELAQAEEQIRGAALAGVDALIVQDIGLVELARAVAPGLPVHGSTQMSITDAAGVGFARDLGIERVVIGRELSIDEIAEVVAETGIAIEVFVHGALCVSYSGQCYSSEAWGGRSANRGQCAQACRLPYGLLVDGVLRDQHDLNYLLSPQDLMALEHLPRLLRAGVRALKIEGRLKGPDYVQATVTAYREAVDSIWSELAVGMDVAALRPIGAEQRRRLVQVFSRGQSARADGLTPGFLDGPQHQSLVIGRNPRHRGVHVGGVVGVGKRGVRVRLHGPVKPGDGLVFDRGQPQQREPGGNVYQVIDGHGTLLTGEVDHGQVELRFGREFDPRQVMVGDLVWRTRDSAQDGRPSGISLLPARKIAVAIEVQGKVGQPLRLTLTDPDGRTGAGITESPLRPADAAPLDVAKLRKAIGRLGDTPFTVGELQIGIDNRDGPLFVPPGQIKAARREAVQGLLAARRNHRRARRLAQTRVLSRLLPLSDTTVRHITPTISLLCRSRDQVEAALTVEGLNEIVVDFLEVHGLKEACHAVRRAGHRLVIAAPRIFKPGEQRLWRYFCRLGPDALLVRSAGLLYELQRLGGSGTLLGDGETRIPPLHGDFSLNAANLLSASMFLRAGLDRLALTHDLNGAQITVLARAMPPALRDRIEVIAHHHLPIFHTEYCLFARFLSRGNSYRDCGRPCERQRVHIRDPDGGDHLVQADIGCRNTVFNARAQSAGPLLASLRNAGIGHYRIELVDEPADRVSDIVRGYRQALAGDLTPDALRRQLRTVPDANGTPQGVGLGSLAVRAERRRESMKKPTAR